MVIVLPNVFLLVVAFPPKEMSFIVCASDFIPFVLFEGGTLGWKLDLTIIRRWALSPIRFYASWFLGVMISMAEL